MGVYVKVVTKFHPIIPLTAFFDLLNVNAFMIFPTGSKKTQKDILVL